MPTATEQTSVDVADRLFAAIESGDAAAVDRRLFAGGLVQQHLLHATGRAGQSIFMRICIVISVGTDGLIDRIDEYFDPAEIAPLLA
jgi:ketosteroid isomerase-like protein